MAKRTYSSEAPVDLSEEVVVLHKPKMSRALVEWDTDEVCAFLRDQNVEEQHINCFKVHGINGQRLNKIDEVKLSRIGIADIDDQQTILKILSNRLHPTCAALVINYNVTLWGNYKIFNDPIHGTIELDDLLLAFVDTPQFQRLRWIKQLGICYLVYPGASHNRFEHSLGVAHLAGEFINILRKSQPELGITDVDVHCVQIAGLCHDLGHGPFSHVYEKKFLPLVRPNVHWKHEDASVKMFDHLVNENHLQDKLAKYNITAQDIVFIKAMIRGYSEQNQNYTGRVGKKQFLHEIVANIDTGNDVRSWDNFARDCYHLGISRTFDHRRFMRLCRVIGSHVCCRDKEAKSLYHMFHSWYYLHRMAYHHKTTQNMENMLVLALKNANDHILYTGKHGKPYKMSECIDDMEAYSKLTDNVFIDILSSNDKNLASARQILLDIQCRRLYQFIGETRPTIDTNTENAIENRDEIAAICKRHYKWTAWDGELVGQIVSFRFGASDKNPFEEMGFYSKDNVNVSFRMKAVDVSAMLPKSFTETTFRLYCKSHDPNVHQRAAEGFSLWCKSKNLPMPRLMLEFTPCDDEVTTAATPERSAVRLAID